MHRNIIYVCSTPPGLITEIKLQHTASSQSSQLGGRFLWSSRGWSRKTLTRDMQGAKQQQLQPTVSPEISGNSSHSLSARTRIFSDSFPILYTTLFLFLTVGMLGDWQYRLRLRDQMQYCTDHPEEVSKLSKVKAQVEQVKSIMMENIDKARSAIVWTISCLLDAEKILEERCFAHTLLNICHGDHCQSATETLI